MGDFSAFDLALQKAGYTQNYAQKLRDIAATCGYRLSFKPSKRLTGGRRKASKKPWSIRHSDDTLVASFATLDALERNLRGRCAC